MNPNQASTKILCLLLGDRIHLSPGRC